MRRSAGRYRVGHGPRKAPVAFLPAVAFADPEDEAERALTPLVGLARRYSARAVALWMYLHIRTDFDTGIIRSGPAQWADPAEHAHDPRTIRAALAELLGKEPTPDGEHLAVLERGDEGLLWTAEYWRIRQLTRTFRPDGKRYPVVRVSGAVLRGGPLVALPDAQRLVYLLFRLFAPAEIRHGKHGDIGARKRTIAFLAKVGRLCEATVAEAARRLRALGLLTSKQHPFQPTLYSCPFDATVVALGRSFHLLYVPDSLVPPAMADAVIGRLVASWFDRLEKRRPARLILA